MIRYRELIVWQRSMVFVTKLYEITGTFPKCETYGLTAQLRRCAVSIPSNIAEGAGRQSDGDFGRFLNIAMGSLFEVQTQLEIAKNLGFLSEMDQRELYDSTREIERLLSSLIRRIKGASK